MTKEPGLCIQTASRILELMEIALEQATRQPVDAPSVMRFEKNYNITAPQLIARLENTFIGLLADFSSKSPPQFTSELKLLGSQQDMDFYTNVVFDQWRQVASTFGVVLPASYFSKQ